MDIIINASFKDFQKEFWEGCSYDCFDFCGCDSYCSDW